MKRKSGLLATRIKPATWGPITSTRNGLPYYYCPTNGQDGYHRALPSAAPHASRVSACPELRTQPGPQYPARKGFLAWCAHIVRSGVAQWLLIAVCSDIGPPLISASE